ncbi:MAG: MATE family efflux transporter [Chlamydiota bacterium]
MTQKNTLTHYPEGSIRELWTVSLPLMISTFASLFMIFTDRIFLARYSIGALNASVNAGTLAWALMAGIGMITAMSEVFVAQYNGAKRYSRLGVPIWQMVWFALFSSLFFLPMSIWGAPLLFSGDLYGNLEIEYFRWLMVFGPSYALMTAFAGFFIGRGKTRVMIWLAIIANVINISLDWVLIFGIPGWIPEMGIRGAAIATCFGYLFESAALGYLFLSKENREKFGTGNWRLDWKEMKKCCRVGFPQGIFCTLEVFGWAVFYWMMTELGEKHITISSICQSFTILLSFFCDGLSRGAAAVAGNLIGAQRRESLNKVLRSGFFLVLLFSAATSLIFVVDPIDTVRILFFEHFNSPASSGFDPSFQASLKICMVFAFVYVLFEGLRWVFSGLLIAAGDTFFLLTIGSLSVWIFLLAPVYFIVVRNNLDIEYAWGLTVVYSVLFFAVYWIRFKQGAWQKINLVSPLPAHKFEDTILEQSDQTFVRPLE